MKNPITNTKQSKSAASGRPVNALSPKNDGTVSKSRKSALKKRVASYGAFNCILPALTILLIGMGMIQGRKFLLMQESNQLINTAQSTEHAGSSGTQANTLTIAGEGNQTILNDSKDDYSIRYCGETERFLSTNKANNLRFVYDAHSFTASGIEPEDSYIKERSDLNDEKAVWSITISAAGISKNGEVPKNAGAFQNSKAKIMMSSAGNRAVAESEDLRIEYSNTEKGMRQDFIVNNKPAGNRDLMLKLDVNTELNFSVSKDAVKFTDASGIAKMNYSSLKVWDAEGKELQAYFAENSSTSKEVSGNPASGFSIIVKDQNAVYPVTIDPLSASPNTILTGSYSFGSAANPAGDVNGDGYDDVIVGAKETTTNMPNDGKVSLFYGSASGVSTTPAWTKTGDTSSTAFGHSVAPAGDVNGDGYDDFLIGNPGFKVNGVSRGRALLFLGSASGPDTTASWTFIGYGISDIGRCVYGAGDVNNDGYDDILVSTAYATFSGSQTGAVYMFYGSSSGPDTAADWEVRGANPFQNFGNSICTAGDINNDGYDDVIIGAPNYSSSTGAVYAYYGSASGLPASPNWTKTGSASGGSFGFIVYKAGDVNGDGYSDIIAGADNYSNGESQEGKAFVYYGGGGGGARASVQQYSPGSSSVVGSGGLTYHNGQVKLAIFARSPFGRTKAKINHEYKTNGNPFSGTVIGNSTGSTGTGVLTNLGLTGTEIFHNIDGLQTGKLYKWRARVKYDLASNPYQKFGPWKYYNNYNPVPHGNFRPSNGLTLNKVLNLTMQVEGFYNPATNTTVQDTVRVYMRNSTSPYAIVDSSTAVFNSTGQATVNFTNVTNGVNYYIQVKHRNSLETWSKTAQAFASGLMNYDFTTAATKAFGDNMKQVDSSPVKFAVYSGDVNKDGTVDATDLSAIDNDATAFASGYTITDLTGDDFVDGTDFAIADNNATTFVSVIRP